LIFVVTDRQATAVGGSGVDRRETVFTLRHGVHFCCTNSDGSRKFSVAFCG
jgi:secreted PhoX family phosphatase